MRIIKVDIKDIQYNYTSYDENLYQSITRIGFSFPLSVSFENGIYKCIDGHKRLSVLSDILQENPNYKRGTKVCVIVKNSDKVRSNDCWRGRNTH